jgi:hypothetical protein
MSEETMVSHLKTDQYTHVARHCPVRVDVCPADDFVEITLGEARFEGVTLRLIVDHPDTFIQLAEALRDGHGKLVDHLRAKKATDPTLSNWTAPR